MKGPSRTIRRRRKEGKTDYKSRFGLLKSGKARVVVRRTNKYLIGQIVSSDIAQDKVVVGVNSKDLLAKGWPKELAGSLKSLPACYLTGYLLGKKSKDVEEGVLDIGLQRNISQSRLYSFLKGLVDSGFKIAHDEKVFPSEEMLNKNEKTGKLIKQIKEKLK
jgi:large subunit ribosomal protein L18|tara:strand:+ start:383 stop:868 length:486 start_codon:yes stop_codon:yes gene_type:complete